MICPRCQGKKSIFGLFPHYDDNFPLDKRKLFINATCNFCEGTGKVSWQTAQWIKDGKILSERRIAKHYTLRKAAKLLKMQVTALSNMELGKCKPRMNITYEDMKIIKNV